MKFRFAKAEPTRLHIWFTFDTHAEVGPVALNEHEVTQLVALFEQAAAIVRAADLRGDVLATPASEDDSAVDEPRRTPITTDHFALRARHPEEDDA